MLDENMFRPPIVRSASAILDRALFSKTVPLAAARVLDRKNISKARHLLEKNKDLLRLERIGAVRDDPDTTIAAKGGKCLLLKPEIKVGGNVDLLYFKVDVDTIRCQYLELISARSSSHRRIRSDSIRPSD